MSDQPIVGPAELDLDFRSLGSTGLKHWAGYVAEDEFKLEGERGIQVWKQMGDGDPICRVTLFVIDKLIRRVKWREEPASGSDFDGEAADFLASCRADMQMAWLDVISEAMTMLQYGHSLLEILYKRRTGETDDPCASSKHTDGRIGWRGFPIRSQDTLRRWFFDASGGIESVEQWAPPNYQSVVIPIRDKALLFRTSSYKNNPRGMSIFRGAYNSWRRKTGIETIEGIGIERDIAGLPVAWVPEELLDAKNPMMRGKLDAIKKIVTNVRVDAQAGLVLPLSYDEGGRKRYDFELMSSGGSRAFDTDKIIQRYDQRIALSALTDFLLLGQGASAQGSWAMHSDKTKLFFTAVSAFLDIIAEVFNTQAIPALFRLNDLKISDYPKLAHGGLEDVDLKDIGDYILKLSQAGMPLFPDVNVEKYLREAAKLPVALESEADIDQQVEPMHLARPDKVNEMYDDGDPRNESPPPPTARGPVSPFARVAASANRRVA